MGWLLRSFAPWGSCRRPGRQGKSPKIRVVYMVAGVYRNPVFLRVLHIHQHCCGKTTLAGVYGNHVFCVFCIYTSAVLLFVFSLLHKESHTGLWRCHNRLVHRLEELPFLTPALVRNMWLAVEGQSCRFLGAPRSQC